MRSCLVVFTQSDVPIARVMDVLSRIGEESDVDKTLDEIEISH